MEINHTEAKQTSATEQRGLATGPQGEGSTGCRGPGGGSCLSVCPSVRLPAWQGGEGISGGRRAAASDCTKAAFVLDTRNAGRDGKQKGKLCLLFVSIIKIALFGELTGKKMVLGSCKSHGERRETSSRHRQTWERCVSCSLTEMGSP